MGTLRTRSLFIPTLLACVAVLAGGIGCRFVEGARSAGAATPPLPGQRDAVYTTAHPTFAAAVSDFFGRRPGGEQPIAFPHNVHAERRVTCTEYCHESATKGPIAGLPSVRTCMICHKVFAKDSPLIQQIAELEAQGLDLTWQRVYGYTPQAHVRFDHAAHLRANVECSTCHGPIADQTVAQRNVDLTMGFCVTCHRANDASDDCLTCHF